MRRPAPDSRLTCRQGWPSLGPRCRVASGVACRADGAHKSPTIRLAGRSIGCILANLDETQVCPDNAPACSSVEHDNGNRVSGQVRVPPAVRTAERTGQRVFVRRVRLETLIIIRIFVICAIYCRVPAGSCAMTRESNRPWPRIVSLAAAVPPHRISQDEAMGFLSAVLRCSAGPARPPAGGLRQRRHRNPIRRCAHPLVRAGPQLRAEERPVHRQGGRPARAGGRRQPGRHRPRVQRRRHARHGLVDRHRRPDAGCPADGATALSPQRAAPAAVRPGMRRRGAGAGARRRLRTGPARQPHPVPGRRALHPHVLPQRSGHREHRRHRPLRRRRGGRGADHGRTRARGPGLGRAYLAPQPRRHGLVRDATGAGGAVVAQHSRYRPPPGAAGHRRIPRFRRSGARRRRRLHLPPGRGQGAGGARGRLRSPVRRPSRCPGKSCATTATCPRPPCSSS